MANNKIETGSVVSMLERLSEYSLERIKDAENEEEYAYALGIFEVATSLYTAMSKGCLALVHIDGNYESTKERFSKWAQAIDPNYQKQMKLDKEMLN